MVGPKSTRPNQSKSRLLQTGQAGYGHAATVRSDHSGHGTCQTGDCGRFLNCGGAGGSPPVALAEFTLNRPVDYYDFSLVDGYNVAMSVVPTGYRTRSTALSCHNVKCESDLNKICPKDLQVVDNAGEVVACKSACMTFNMQEYCCTEEYATPEKYQ